MQVHILSFEGPDPYSRAGGLATRVDGLGRALSRAGFETHLWFVGDPRLSGEEVVDKLHLHRWAQWLSAYHPGGVYDGEVGKRNEYAASLPPYLCNHYLTSALRRGERALVLAEEWHSVDAVLHLDWQLRQAGVRDRVSILWNANNTFGFDAIDWARLSDAAVITTVSRYMKQRMWSQGVDPLVIPNGLSAEAFLPCERAGTEALRRCVRGRTFLIKVARWDPDKRWQTALEIVAELKRREERPLLLARGGREPYGDVVLAAARNLGLRVVDREQRRAGAQGMPEVLRDIDGVDIVNLRSPIDPENRRVLFQGAQAVLANSAHEPFGLVGLETMAVGGIACTGCSGEDYAVPGQNALVLETGDPREFLGLLGWLRANPDKALALRRAGRSAARRYAWPKIVWNVLLPRVELLQGLAPTGWGEPIPRLRAAPGGAGRTSRDERISPFTWHATPATGLRARVPEVSDQRPEPGSETQRPSVAGYASGGHG